MKMLRYCAVTMLVLFAVVVSLAAQVAPAAAPLPVNLYFAGTSYSQGATPSIAGTALYARLLSANSSSSITAAGVTTTSYPTYVFTMVDAIPASLSPFTVNTSIGGGIAQQVATIAKVPIFIPTAAGISYTGSNVGWAWSTGVGVPFQVKGSNWYVMPTLRINKSSVGNSGYQPIVGVLFGWGQ